MEPSPSTANRRILVVDDQEVVHFTFESILTDVAGAAGVPAEIEAPFELDSAFQGEQAVEKVREAVACGRPYALAFVDIQMPPGCDGIETIGRLWQESPDLQVVLCSASTEHSWGDIIQRLGLTDRLVILKKPFDRAEILQLACAMTEKWRLHRQARLNMEELERRVAARTAEIEHAHRQLLELNLELAAARDAAESGSHAKSEFLANMSHELRTPLTAISGYADLMLDPDQSPADRSYCAHTIGRNADHLIRLISDMLDISRIEAGGMTVEQIPFSPREIVQDLAALVKIEAERKRLGFTVRMDDRVPQTIVSDPTRVRQILNNLLDNAIKFTTAGEVRLLVTAVDPTADRGPCLSVEVSDTGLGMNEEQLARVFEVFVQGDSSTSRRFGGAGLGLAIARRLAEMLGGEIQAASRPGCGSTFRVLLPLNAVDQAASRSDVACGEEPPPEPRQRPLLDCRVLVAEDSRDLQRLMSFLLRKNGAEVTLARDGREAANLAIDAWERDRPFDVVLMDIEMPRLDGYEATRLLRQIGYPGPIVALTAHAMTGVREKCIAAGCTDYAFKPIAPARLISLLAQYGRTRPEVIEPALVNQ